MIYKNPKQKKLIILNLFIVIALTILFLITISAETSQDLTSPDFNNGTFVNTSYNSSGFVQITNGNFSGSFISRIFDANRTVTWLNFSFLNNLLSISLPDNQEIETSYNGIKYVRKCFTISFR
jgi:hypothetical protein